jgi:hypothetical protein
MLPGESYIYKCPKCNNLIVRETLGSGNTFGAVRYSDGKTIAPMLPEYPDLTKCKKCNQILWLSKMKEVASCIFYIVRHEWPDAQFAKFLSIGDYVRALKLGIATDKDDELFICMHIWWAYNDRIRDGKKVFVHKNDEARWKENIIRLKNLLDYNKIEDKLLLAEVHRNEGDYKACMYVLKTIKADEWRLATEKMADACKKKNRWVIKLYGN